MHSSVAVALPDIAILCARLGVERLDLFGSAVDQAAEPRDVDVLVEFGPVPNRFDAYFALKEGLERLLGREVDVVMADAVANPYVRTAITTERTPLYAA